MNKDVRIIRDQNIEISEIKEKYIQDFLLEIEEHLDSIEIKLVNLEADPVNRDFLSAVYNDIHTIKGLTGFMDDEAANDIILEIEGLLDVCKKYGIAVVKEIINAVIQSVIFIRKLCKYPGIANEGKFAGEVEQYMQNIKTLKGDLLIEARQSVNAKGRIGEILIEEGFIREEDVADLLEKQNKYYQKMKFGEIAVKEKVAGASDIIKAIRTQKSRHNLAEQNVSIPFKQLLQLISKLDDIQKIHAGMRHDAILRFGSNDFFTIETDRAENILLNIKNTLSSMKAVALKDTFHRLNRAVCTFIEEHNIDIMFSAIGDNVEIDRQKAEQIFTPLYEIIRLIIEVGSNNMKIKTPKNLEVVAYYDKEKRVHIDIANDDCPQKEFQNHKNTIDSIKEMIYQAGGKLTIEDISDGCKVMIVI